MGGETSSCLRSSTLTTTMTENHQVKSQKVNFTFLFIVSSIFTPQIYKAHAHRQHAHLYKLLSCHFVLSVHEHESRELRSQCHSQWKHKHQTNTHTRNRQLQTLHFLFISPRSLSCRPSHNEAQMRQMIGTITTCYHVMSFRSTLP